MQITAPLVGLVDVGDEDGRGFFVMSKRIDSKLDSRCEHFKIQAPVRGARRHSELQVC